MISTDQLTGAVLAGGQSSRMGRDKATLPCDGKPMWERQIAVLRASGANPIAIVRQSGQTPLGLPNEILLWHDTVIDAGPLAGLQTALNQCRTSLLAVLAIDMPRIDPWWFEWMGSYCGSSVGAMVCRPDGIHEPLAAIYPRTALAVVNARIQTGDRSLQSLASALIARQLLRSVPLPIAELWRVVNWNTPAESGLSGEDST